VQGQPDVKKLYHVRIEKGFALIIVTCYATGQDEQLLMDVLSKSKMQ